MAPQVQLVDVMCVNVDCRRYQLCAQANYPTLTHGVFLVGALHCSDCGEPLTEVSADRR